MRLRSTSGLLAMWVGLAVACPAAAESADLLIRVERRHPGDLAELSRAGLPVVLETLHSLYLEGTPADRAAAERLGFATRVLDTRASGSDYLQVGVRPDSDLDALRLAGAEIWAEDNWRLLRVPRGVVPERLFGARVHLTRLPHEPWQVSNAAPQSVAAVDGACGPFDPIVAKIVAGVSPTAIDGYWRDLTLNPPSGTRMSTSAGCDDAAEYVRDGMLDVGIAAQLAPYSGTHAANVVGTHAGAVHPDRVYIVMGHLDDLPSWGLAPGADDNASGSVTVLESARATSCWAFRNTIKYLAVTGEEWGLYGSDAYAADAAARGEDIRGVLNFDMNGWQGDGLPGPENLDLNYNAASEELALRFADCASQYSTGIVVDAFLCPSLTASDHYSFWRRGYPAVCGITDNEGYCGHGGYYPYYHQRTDTIPACGDPAFFRGTIRATVATLATLAEPFKITFSTSTVPASETTVTLIVGDRDLDQSASQAETLDVEVWSEAEPAGETVRLTERSASNLLFSAEVAVTLAPAIAGDGKISVAPGGTLRARYVDARDCDGATAVEYVAQSAVEALPRPGEVGVLTLTRDATTRLEWSAVAEAGAYDVAGGSIAELRADTGWARAACLADDVVTPAWDDPRTEPAVDDGYYYLVRAQGAGGSGTWGSSSGAAERVLPAACP